MSVQIELLKKEALAPIIADLTAAVAASANTASTKANEASNSAADALASKNLATTKAQQTTTDAQATAADRVAVADLVATAGLNPYPNVATLPSSVATPRLAFVQSNADSEPDVYLLVGSSRYIFSLIPQQ